MRGTAHRKGHTRFKTEEQLRAAVRRQYAAGLSDSRIARVLGVGWETVKRVRKALGLPANKGGAQ